jgi:glycerol kinase
VLDPYFSATKLRWLLAENTGWRGRAERGELACGTIDSFLVSRLTGGKSHVTDVTNASRTLLLGLHTRAWDDELCRFFEVPRAILPAVLPSAADFGVTRGLEFLPDDIPIAGVAGDQQAALFGQTAFAAGESKCTYGTGAFFLLHTGSKPVLSSNGLLTTVAAMADDRPQYAIEGAVFVAGAAVQWLRDGLKLFASAAASESLAEAADPNQPTLFVPSFVGLGAPHWVPEARGAMFGLTRNTGPAELARATLEGVAFQVADLVEAAKSDAAAPVPELRVDGGMTQNRWFLQTQANLLGLPVHAAAHAESTALGAAFLAGLKVGVWSDQESLRRLTSGGARYAPDMPASERERRQRQWRRAVRAVIAYDAEAADVSNR